MGDGGYRERTPSFLWYGGSCLSKIVLTVSQLTQVYTKGTEQSVLITEVEFIKPLDPLGPSELSINYRGVSVFNFGISDQRFDYFDHKNFSTHKLLDRKSYDIIKP